MKGPRPTHHGNIKEELDFSNMVSETTSMSEKIRKQYKIV